MDNKLGASTRAASGRSDADAPQLLAWGWLWSALLLLLGATALAWWQDPLPVPANRTPQTHSVWTQFRKPLETNPHRRLITVASRLLSIAFADDGLRGWAVGEGGTILATADGGTTWAAQASGTARRLNAVRVLPDGLHAWAVGEDGTALATTNGGSTWVAHTSNTTDELTAISVLPDGLRAWTVGSSGTILATIDGGTTWTAQSRALTKRLPLATISVLPDGMRAWTVGYDGAILATTNGGTTWAAQASTTRNDLTAISVLPDGLRAWAVGKEGTILATTDGGTTWAAQTSATTTLLTAVSALPDGLRAWAMGDGGTILATTNGGKTWTPRNSTTTNWLTAASVLPDGLRAWAVGYGGTIITTTDGGTTWAAQTNATTKSLNAISALQDGLRAWAVGYGGTILATTDGGKTWAAQTSAITHDLFAISVLPGGLRAWTVGEKGTILATTDGGTTWTAQSSTTTSRLNAIHVLPDGLHAWAVGEEGIILATTDGGTAWTAQSSIANETLTAIYVLPDGRRAWIVTEGGGVLVTTNGGTSWDFITTTTSHWLAAISVLADGLHAWAVGDTGSILASTDGGTTWVEQANHTTSGLQAISVLPDGQHAWAVGQEGAILATADGGKSWTAQSSSTTSGLSAISVLPDGQHAWAVGEAGTILATTDGGHTWAHAERYSRSPAPWYWLAVALAAGLAWQSWRQRPSGHSQESVAGVAASDAEVRQAADDRLEFGGLARGISRFLRNTETRPPLTMAITGDWGSGKSSLMQLVCADLRRFGHRPIWFNAWHHQKEEHLFAALLGAIHAQAAPALCTPNGIAFRLRLLWLRSKQHLGVMVLMVGVVTCLVVLSGGAFQRGGFPSVMLMLAALHHSAAAQLATLTALGAAVSGLLTLFKGAEVFGVNPALLLNKVRNGMSLKTAAAQNDFRAQFAQQFGELVRALPYRLVIVIDDLDRCRPTTVLDVMETVNYLTSAGDCFVIFGMASERVQAALGLAFKDIAAELVHMDGGESATMNTAATDPALAKRRAYASDYLQKLVNIEIKVPTASNHTAHQLLQAPEPVPRRQAMELLRGLWQLWPLAAALGAAAIGGWVATSMVPTTAVTPAPATTVSAPQQPSPVAPPPKGDASDAVAIKPLTTRDVPVPPPVQPGDTVPAFSVLAWLALALAPLACITVLVVLRLLSKTLQETRDSPRFREALEIWTGVVAQKRATPRAIKRFGNRLRYLAMLQQGESLDTTWWDVLKARWHRVAHTEAAAVPPLASDALAEHQLIAIGALYEVHGKDWKEKIEAFASQDWDGFLNDKSQPDGAAAQAFTTAVQQHQNKFDIAWPPSEKELAVFERLISGVRLAGDPQTLSPSARASEVESYAESMSSSAAPRKTVRQGPAEPA